MSPVPRRGFGDGRGSQPNFSAAALMQAIERARLKPLSSCVLALNQLQSELHRIRLRGRGELVDEALGCERHLRTIGVAQVAGAKRRLERHRQRHHARGLQAVRNRIHVRRQRGAAGRDVGAARAHQLRDQHRVVLVVAEVIVIGGARVVMQRHEIALRVEAAAHLHRIGRTLRVPRRFFLARPLHPHRPADLLRQIRRLEPRIVRRGAAVGLRAFHPDHAHAVARHVEELRHAVAHAVRLHVVRIDRQLIVRRIGERMRGTDRGVALERHVVLGFDHRGRAGEPRIGIAGGHGLAGG